MRCFSSCRNCPNKFIGDDRPGRPPANLLRQFLNLCEGWPLDSLSRQFSPRLSDGVMVAQSSLEALVMVRIHVGQPIKFHKSPAYFQNSTGKTEDLAVYFSG